MKKIFLLFLVFNSATVKAATFFNDRLSLQGFLKISGAPLDDATGFPMRFIIKRNTTVVWCQTSASNVVVANGIFNQTISGLSNCQSLANALDGSVFAHTADSDVFTVDVVVDYLKNGFNGGDDATFAGIDLVPAPMAIYSHYANLADNISGIVPLTNGGTGATSVAAARTSLGLGNLATLSSPGVATQVLRGDGTFGTAPALTLTGDVTGTSSASVVNKIKGRTLSANVPSNGQVLTWNNTTTSWEPQTPSSAPVTTVAGKTGAITLVSDDVSDATTSATANMIVKRDSSGDFAAGTITANLNGSATNVTGTVAVVNGGTGGTTAAVARTNLGAAASGTNTDITSINGSARQASVTTAPATLGSNTAYTLAFSPALSSIPNGTTIHFRPHDTNTGPATLEVDGLGAKNIFSQFTGVAVAAGDIVLNRTVEATFDGTNWIAALPPQIVTATALSCGTSIAARSFVTCTIPAATVNAGDVVNCSPTVDVATGQVTWSSLATAGNISVRLGCNNAASTCTITNRNWRCVVNK